MSLVIRRIAIENFRKFRDPFTIDNLTDGLNIIIEPNETGKSTLMEALRAAFFVRHNTQNQLAKSYAPRGDSVAPRVEIDFLIDGAEWSLRKRFLKSASIDVEGPQGRAQGDEAEALLNTLLGSVRDTSRAGDVSTYGALGLLWVAQMDALEIRAPGAIVRDTITASLEAEVGSIMGGEAYRKVRERVDAQYELYWTPTGVKKGRQVDALRRFEVAVTASAEADGKVAQLEKSFGELDVCRQRLSVLQREMADQTDSQTRAELVSSLEVARMAAQLLATRQAENEVAAGRLAKLEDIQTRHEAAVLARDKAATALQDASDLRATSSERVKASQSKVGDARLALLEVQAAHQRAADAYGEGLEAHKEQQLQDATAEARHRYRELVGLEAELEAMKRVELGAIPKDKLAALEANERAAVEARARVDAGAAHVTLSGEAEGVMIDGEPMAPGTRALTQTTRIQLGSAELVITPPASAASAEELLAEAVSKQEDALFALGVADLAAARERTIAAREASAEIRTLMARIAAASPADDRIGLAAGADALKLFVYSLTEPAAGVDHVAVDLDGLKRQLEIHATSLARAEGVVQSAIENLRKCEAEEAPQATAEALAQNDLTSAQSAIASIEAHPDWEGLAEALLSARQRAAEAAIQLDAATRNATAHDVADLNRKIATIDARTKAAVDQKTAFDKDIARLEATIESEGGRGLAEQAAAARDELDASRAALQRVTDEANTIMLLRNTLEAARNETSARFVGPVARRAKGYIERLLPGCELAFSDSMALESVIRAGTEEQSDSLSRGTQEQLAILTRIAFADMLRDQGKPISLILDDPLVYSDDARLDTMIDILTEAASQMQVILLTCRDRAFRHVDGNRVRLVD
jgi:hypothetical protein